VNFSSIRQGTLDEREHWKELQQWLIENCCKPIRAAYLKYRLLSGGILMKNGKPVPATKLAECMKAEWQARRWDWIDPRADTDANIANIRAGLAAPSTIIRESGRDPEAVFRQFAQDLEAMKSAGIPDEITHLFLFGEAPPPSIDAQQAAG